MEIYRIKRYKLKQKQSAEPKSANEDKQKTACRALEGVVRPLAFNYKKKRQQFKHTKILRARQSIDPQLYGSLSLRNSHLHLFYLFRKSSLRHRIICKSSHTTLVACIIHSFAL